VGRKYLHCEKELASEIYNALLTISRTGNQKGTLTKITIWYFPEEEIYFANNHMKQFSN
jgi:hypothetical protein